MSSWLLLNFEDEENGFVKQWSTWQLTFVVSYEARPIQNEESLRE